MCVQVDDGPCDAREVTEGVNDIEWDTPPFFDVTGTVLMGLPKAPEAERRRPPDNRSQVDVEIHGQDPLDRMESTLAASASLLESIDELRSAAERLAPAEWCQEYLDKPEYPGLFLEGFEFHDDGVIRVLFDFGDLDLLVLGLNPDGTRRVTVESALGGFAGWWAADSDLVAVRIAVYGLADAVVICLPCPRIEATVSSRFKEAVKVIDEEGHHRVSCVLRLELDVQMAVLCQRPDTLRVIGLE